MNILWILGQIFSALALIVLGAAIFEKNQKRIKYYVATSVLFAIIYLILFIIRMNQINDILRTI